MLPVITALASGIGNAVATHYQTKKLAKAYEEAAERTRAAAKKYSGHNADEAMKQAGQQEARIAQQLARNYNQTQDGNLSMQNAMNNMQDTSAAAMQGNALGRQNKQTDLNAKYNKATADIQNSLSKAKTDYNVGNQTQQFIMNTLGNGANLLGQAGGLQGASDALTAMTAQSPFSNITLGGQGMTANLGGGAMTSDERAKTEAKPTEYNNKEGLPKADAEDALRQIESIEYKYKPETGLDQDSHVGVTAQSLEGTAFEDAVVQPGEKGNNSQYKALDKQKLLESVMAGIAALQKELDDQKSFTSDMNAKESPCSQIEEGVESGEVQSAPLPSIQKEIDQMHDSNPKNDEFNNKAIPDWYIKGIIEPAKKDWDEWQSQMYGTSSKDKRDAGGQFYTPPEVALQMYRQYDHLPKLEDFDNVEDYKKAVFENPKTIFDPTAGAGSLLIPAILSGHDPRLVYGLEEDPNKVQMLRNRLAKYGVPGRNIQQGSALDDRIMKRMSRIASEDPYYKKRKREYYKAHPELLPESGDVPVAEKGQGYKRSPVLSGLAKTMNMSKQEIKQRIVNGEAEEVEATLKPAAYKYLLKNAENMSIDEIFSFIKSNFKEK